MSELLQAGPDRLHALRRRAQRCCVAFSDEVLPPGASRPRGRVGIEINRTTGQALLHVERGIAYSGPSSEVADWFETGTATFRDFDELCYWLSGPLAAAYAGHASSTDDQRAQDDEREREVAALIVDESALTAALEAEVIGQRRSAEALARATALHLARSRPRRPLAALAMGPTGVGKTLMAETLADAISATSQAECHFLRLDMTEFQERHTVSKLLGAPPGYVGFGDDPQLAQTLRSDGRAVILIDEIEKAHPDVFLSLMNLIDAGRLTPASGGTIDARASVLIFTTNLAVDVVSRALADAGERSSDTVSRDGIVRTALRANGIAPELVGRLHELLVFDPLAPEHVDAIVVRSIEREAATFGLELRSVEPGVVTRLRQWTPDPGSGARAWEYLISAEVGPALLRARRDGLAGPVTLAGWPVTVSEVGD